MPSAAPASSGRSASATAGNVGRGNPWGSTPMTSTPCDARSKITVSGNGCQHGEEDAGQARGPTFHAQNDDQGQQANRQRPRVRLIEILKNGEKLLKQAIGVDRKAEELWAVGRRKW